VPGVAVSEGQRHVNGWDIRVVRNFSPLYTLSGKRYDNNPVGAVTVEIGAEFDDNDAALEFERKVRELLEAS
jgi:hypothetical protein